MNTYLMFLAAPAIAGRPVHPWMSDRTASTVRIALIAGEAGPDAVAAAAATRPDAVWIVGLQPRHTLADWDGIEVMATAAERPGRRFLSRFAGAGVRGLGKAVPYGHVDLEVSGWRWRVLTVTGHERPARLAHEQAFWLPRALDRRDYDGLIVLSDRTGDAAFETVRGRADPLAFAMWIHPGAQAPALPGGPFGELQLSVGELGSAPDQVLETGFEGIDRVEGFWTLEIVGRTLTLDFHARRGDAFEVVYRLLRGRRGWRVP